MPTRLAVCLSCAVGALLALSPRSSTGAAPEAPSSRRAWADLRFLEGLRGASGKLAAALRAPGEPLLASPPRDLAALYVPNEGRAIVSRDFVAPQHPGVYALALEDSEGRRQIADLRVITLVPFDAKKNGQIGSYRLGLWPFEGRTAPSAAYATPSGFVEVTPENRHLPVSLHFTLGDFLTKDQSAVWPKYLLLDARLVDKLELVIAELERGGHPVEHLAVMSGFRTPLYNRSGGATGGRATLSRHIYGDATDVFVDNDRNGWTDDVNADGRVDIRDAELVALAADRAEQLHPDLVGGVGVYAANSVHGPFTHVDVRGRRARWRGSVGG